MSVCRSIQTRNQTNFLVVRTRTTNMDKRDIHDCYLSMEFLNLPDVTFEDLEFRETAHRILQDTSQNNYQSLLRVQIFDLIPPNLGLLPFDPVVAIPSDLISVLCSPGIAAGLKITDIDNGPETLLPSIQRPRDLVEALTGFWKRINWSKIQLTGQVMERGLLHEEYSLETDLDLGRYIWSIIRSASSVDSMSDRSFAQNGGVPRSVAELQFTIIIERRPGMADDAEEPDDVSSLTNENAADGDGGEGRDQMDWMSGAVGAISLESMAGILLDAAE